MTTARLTKELFFITTIVIDWMHVFSERESDRTGKKENNVQKKRSSFFFLQKYH